VIRQKVKAPPNMATNVAQAIQPEIMLAMAWRYSERWAFFGVSDFISSSQHLVEGQN
jgi:hypothetical protein